MQGGSEELSVDDLASTLTTYEEQLIQVHLESIISAFCFLFRSFSLGFYSKFTYPIYVFSSSLKEI